MSFLKTLFGIALKSKPAPQSTSKVSVPANHEPDLIRVRDAQGEEFHVTRQEWFDKVLAGRFRDSWDDSEQLAVYIAQTINDDFFEESIGAAERLVVLEDTSRSAGLLARAQLGAGRVDDAERIVRDSLARHGKSAATLTSLAHCEALRGHHAGAITTLRQALETDPNHEDAIRWYESCYREDGGEAAGIEALSQVATFPGAWRARLWLGQHAMHSEQPERALAMFRECVAQASRPVPMDVLADISAALGSAGYFREIEEVVEPVFEPKVHGVHVGSNLMRAHAELGEFGKARKILDQLSAVVHPDSEAQLQYWRQALASAEAEGSNA